MGFKAIRSAVSDILKTNIWKKFTKPTVRRGQTVWPKAPADLSKYGVRFDYDGEIIKDGVTYHKFQCQPNAGKVPSSVKRWRDSNGGFYFDADRGKYFRIQPNHIAPQDAKYSRQAVTAERNLKEQQEYDPPLLLRSSYLDGSCAGAVLRRRLGGVRQLNSSAIAKHEWAARVEGRTVFSNLMCDTFVVNPETGQLFTQCQPTASGPRSWPMLCVTRPRITPTAASNISAADASTWNPVAARTMYTFSPATFIDEPHGRVARIDTVNNSSNAIFWITHQIDQRPLPHEFIGNDEMCDIERLLDGGGQETMRMSTLGGGNLHKRMMHGRMCVEWKGPNVVMTGDRAGQILLSDVRMPAAAAVIRATCPWAVSALRSVGHAHNNTNGILAWGLEGGRLFDLRFCKDQDDVNTIIFDVRPGRKQMRYGMAFDYDDQLGIVASASTDFYKTHRMGLWDVSSGKMLDSSPLVQHQFPQPVTCAQFVDLEHRGGIKTLLTGSGRDIMAWDM
ncbi:hypothetical protein DV735_g1433, partial [Chaetothyriales sp. CBS 134920]